MRRPNILLILTDQQTAGAMSATGNPYLRTPGMDALAEGGIRFQRAYCTAPVCGPARASLIGGRMPHDLGVNVNGDPPHQSMRNLGQVFRDEGYETAWAGKWHVPDGSQSAPGAITGFRKLPTRQDVKPRYGVEGDDLTADAAITFIRERSHDSPPFLLCASLTNPHDICYWVMNHPVIANVESDASLPPLPGNFAIDPDEPEFIQECRRRTHYGPEVTYTAEWDDRRWRDYLYAYYRFTERVDACIGRILSALKAQGLEQDTLVVLTTDHGEGCAAQHWVVKLMFWETVVNIPLVVRWPGVIPEGAVDASHLASSQDLLPTLCDYAGVAPPEDMTGASLRPVVERPELPGPEFVVSELQPDPLKPEMRGRMLRAHRSKYVAFSHGARPEMLFDMVANPGETRNLALEPAHADELAQHHRLLAEWVAATGDCFRAPGLKGDSSTGPSADSGQHSP